MFGNKDATDAAFASAKHVVKLRVENNRLAANAMEPRVAHRRLQRGRDSTRYTRPRRIRTACATELSHRVPCARRAKIRVISPDVGGGFGLKGGPYPDDALVLWASRKLRRPVKWTATRDDSILNDRTAAIRVIYGEMALDDERQDSRHSRATLFQAIGAYFVGPASAAGGVLAALHPGALRRAGDHVITCAVFTNTAPIGPIAAPVVRRRSISSSG